MSATPKQSEAGANLGLGNQLVREERCQVSDVALAGGLDSTSRADSLSDRPAIESGTKDEEREASLPRRVVAEAVGAFFLTMAAAGGEIIAVVSKGQLGPAAKVAAPALVVMAAIYSLGDVSGAHFNPVVTIAFAIRGVFQWSHVPVYWLAQVTAATAAALGLRALFGNVAHIGAPQPHLASGKAAAIEVVLTALLILVVLNTATRARVVGPNAAIAVGGTIALCGVLGAPLSGAAMNPARALGPEVVGADWAHAWIYVVGPIIGAVVAVALTAILHPVANEAEVDAAEGERNTPARASKAADLSEYHNAGFLRLPEVDGGNRPPRTPPERSVRCRLDEATRRTRSSTKP